MGDRDRTRLSLLVVASKWAAAAAGSAKLDKRDLKTLILELIPAPEVKKGPLCDIKRNILSRKATEAKLYGTRL